MKIINDYVKIYKEFPLAAIICDVNFHVYWSNALAKTMHGECTETQGLWEVLSEFDLAEIKEEAFQRGNYTLQGIFPMSGVRLSLSPILQDGIMAGLVLLFMGRDTLLQTENFVQASKTADAVCGSVRASLDEIFNTLDSAAFKLELVGADWMRTSFNRIVDNGYRILRVANNIGEYARFQSGRQDFRFALVNFFGFVADVSDVALSQCEVIGIPVTIHMPKTTIYVKLDVEKYGWAFFNILHNSLYFTRPGNAVEISYASNDEWVTITVKDKGLGIPAEVLPDVFRPYFTYGHGGSTGVGLGLAIATRVITGHGGDIRIKSQLGVGTTVTIRLPVQSAFSGTLPLAQSVDPLSLGNRFSSIYVGLADAALSPYRK